MYLTVRIVHYRHGGLADAAIHVRDLSGYTRGQVAEQEGCHIAHLFDGHVAAQGEAAAEIDSNLPKSLMPLAARVLMAPALSPLTRMPR